MKIERYMFLSVLVHVELPGFKMYSLLLMQVLIWHAGHSQTITISATSTPSLFGLKEGAHKR